MITSIRMLAGALPRHGHTSTLVAPRHQDTPYDPDLPVAGLPSMPCGIASLRLAAWPRSRHVGTVAALRPELIHVHTPGRVGLLGILAAHLESSDVVVVPTRTVLGRTALPVDPDLDRGDPDRGGASRGGG